MVADIDVLLKREEGKTLEFKRDLSSPQNILKTLVAFANTSGGILLIGIANGTHEIIGVENPLIEEERLCNLIADNIEPRLLPDIDILSRQGKTVLAVEVFSSPLRPHFLTSQGTEGVFVRLGSTNRKADADLIADLRRTAAGESYDEQPLPDFGTETIDLPAISGLFLDKRTISEKELETLRIVVRHGKRLVPTIGGFLLFSKDRERIFPDAWIQCGRFAGKDKRYISDTLEIHDLLPLTIEKAIDFLKKHAMRRADLSEIKRRDVWNIPLSILREAVINAVVHADYSQKGAPIRISFFDDRIEIENPGILLPGLTIEDIRHGVSKLRNRVIGRTFKELGLIEQWGSGIRRMFDEARDLGLSEPRMDELGMRFRLTIFLPAPDRPKDRELESRLESRLESGLAAKIMILLKEADAGKSGLASSLGHKTVSGELHKQIKRLMDETLIEMTIPDKPNSRLQKYKLTEKGQEILREILVERSEIGKKQLD